VKATEKVIFRTQEALQACLDQSPVSKRHITAYVEWQHNRRFTRKTLGFSNDDYWLDRQVHLSVSYYDFCLPHGGLREEIFPPIPTKASGSPEKWRHVTPMMSAGVTDHVWTLQDLLTYRLPPDAHVGISCIKPRLIAEGPEQAAPTGAPPAVTIIPTVKGHYVDSRYGAGLWATFPYKGQLLRRTLLPGSPLLQQVPNYRDYTGCRGSRGYRAAFEGSAPSEPSVLQCGVWGVCGIFSWEIDKHLPALSSGGRHHFRRDVSLGLQIPCRLGPNLLRQGYTAPRPAGSAGLAVLQSAARFAKVEDHF
jgi:hypothetical protein